MLQESLANAKERTRQQCAMRLRLLKAPSEEIYGESMQ